MIIKTYFVHSIDKHWINVTANEFNRDVQAFGWKLSKDPVKDTDTHPLFERNIREEAKADPKASFEQYLTKDGKEVAGRIYHSFK